MQEVQTVSLLDIINAHNVVALYRWAGNECDIPEDITIAEVSHELPPEYEAIAMSALVGFLTNKSEINTDYNNFLLANYISVSEQMLTDETTGYLNKRGLYHWAKNEYDPEHNTYGIFAVDLERFKKVNDSLGHAVGDDALRAACDVIASQTRMHTGEGYTDTPNRRARKTEDILSVARVGGDEIVFVMNFNGLDTDTANEVITRVQEGLRLRNVVMSSDDGSKEQSFGFRVGSVRVGPRNQMPFLEAVKLADFRQYQTRTDKER